MWAASSALIVYDTGTHRRQPLSLDERTDMQRDYARGLFEGTRTGDWTLPADAEASWRATAEVAGDPALSASLLAERDPAREIALRRP